MKGSLIVCILLLFVCARISGQENNSVGIIYGPKTVFKIDAPRGWVIDNQVGVKHGVPCVLFPKGQSSDAGTIMYASIAAPEFEDVEKFVAWAIKDMEKDHGRPNEKIDKGKTGDGQPYFINEYPATKAYSRCERVAYVQLHKAVAYIVLTSPDESSYRKDAPALNEALKSFVELDAKAASDKQ